MIVTCWILGWLLIASIFWNLVQWGGRQVADAEIDEYRSITDTWRQRCDEMETQLLRERNAHTELRERTYMLLKADEEKRA